MKVVKTALILSCILGLASCSSAPKKVPYVVGAETIPQEFLSEVDPKGDPVLAPGDLLNIEVSATNMVAVAPFNKGMMIGENGQVTRLPRQTSSNTQGVASTEYYLIDANGYIDFPGIGMIKAADMTKQQLAKEIADAIYPKYTTERPTVDIRLMNFRVTFIGSVKSPGVYTSENERLNFFEGLAMAGDLTIRGERETILLYRINPNGTREVHRLNIHDKDFLLSPYFNLQQNDVIYVVPNESEANSSWSINPAVGATLTYVGGIGSVLSLVVGVINLTKK